MTITAIYPNRRGYAVSFTNKNGKKRMYSTQTRTLKNENTNQIIKTKVRMSNVMGKRDRRVVRSVFPSGGGAFLTEQNRFSHAKYIKPLLRNIIPDKYLPLKRVGPPVRSVDGAAFALRDRTKVGKIIFYGSEQKLKNIMNEYEIGKRMGEIGVGPHVYKYYLIDASTYHNVPKNLLMNNMTSTKKAVYIVMENLAHGAKNLKPLAEYLHLGNPYPTAQISKLVSKMHAKNIQHGDLHQWNILVKTFHNGMIRVYIIDYGRSLYVPAKNARKYMTNVMGFKSDRINGYVSRSSSNLLRIPNMNKLPPSLSIKSRSLNNLSPLKKMFSSPKPRYVSKVTNNKFALKTVPLIWLRT